MNGDAGILVVLLTSSSMGYGESGCESTFRKKQPGDFVLSRVAGMRYIPAMQEPTRDHGPQPLDSLLTRWGITNHQLVEESVEQLNHKQVQRARKGRQLTLRLMQKIARTLNDAIVSRLPKEKHAEFSPYIHKHLFNYTKSYDPAWVDPNEPLMPQ